VAEIAQSATGQFDVMRGAGALAAAHDELEQVLRRVRRQLSPPEIITMSNAVALGLADAGHWPRVDGLQADSAK
jgi:hypothetical protein